VTSLTSCGSIGQRNFVECQSEGYYLMSYFDKKVNFPLSLRRRNPNRLVYVRRGVFLSANVIKQNRQNNNINNKHCYQTLSGRVLDICAIMVHFCSYYKYLSIYLNHKRVFIFRVLLSNPHEITVIVLCDANKVETRNKHTLTKHNGISNNNNNESLSVPVLLKF
jgi:hypothetical protein